MKQDHTHEERRDRKIDRRKKVYPGPLAASHRQVGPARWGKKTLDKLVKKHVASEGRPHPTPVPGR